MSSPSRCSERARGEGVRRPFKALWGAAASLTCIALLGACQSVPPNRYGVQSLTVEGAEIFDPDSITKCLATQQRDYVDIDFDVLDAPRCGMPPFEGDRARWELWAWPWTEWPYYDRVMLEQDVARIERWYAARGHHHAHVTEVDVSPESAADVDLLDPDDPEPGCTRRSADEGCEVEITIHVEEGEPTLIEELNIYGLDDVPEDFRQAVMDALEVKQGERWDEAFYDRSKVAVKTLLASEGYALAELKGQVRIDRPRRSAVVDLQISPGPICVFGSVIVDESGELPAETIGAAALIYRGQQYSQEEIVEAQRAIYGLGAFAAVTVEPILPEEGNVVDVKVTVEAARKHRFGLGGGFTSGIVERRDFAQTSIERWDVHLIARYENRNFFGGLRRLTTRIVPRLIFPQSFPGASAPQPGLLTSVEFRQPAFLEPRTTLRVDFTYDLGLDLRDTFFRHQFDAGINLERFFWRQRIFVSLGLPRYTLFVVPSRAVDRRNEQRLTRPELPELPSDYHLLRLEQIVWLDLRDDPVQPHKGFYLQVNLQEAGYIWGSASSWNYIRIQPDVRAYIPLPQRITIAARFLMGAMFVTGVNDETLDQMSQDLGPRTERFYGGGAAGNRGYVANRLGAGRAGGIRRWLAQVELRVPVTANVGLVGFVDAGDTSRTTNYHFDHLHLAAGLGFRYYTIIGPIRVDLGVRIPSFTKSASEDPGHVAADETNVSLGFFQFPGALHVSIGESF